MISRRLSIFRNLQLRRSNAVLWSSRLEQGTLLGPRLFVWMELGNYGHAASDCSSP